MENRNKIKMFRVCVVLVLFLCIYFLYFQGEKPKIKEIKMSEISEAALNSYISVTGTILETEQNRVFFTEPLTCGTGFLIGGIDGVVKAILSNFVWNNMSKREIVPEFGDYVKVSGKLENIMGKIVLHVYFPEHFEITKSDKSIRTIRDIKNSPVQGRLVSVTGSIMKVMEMPWGILYRLNEIDGVAEFPEQINVIKKYGEDFDFSRGNDVQVNDRVEINGVIVNRDGENEIYAGGQGAVIIKQKAQKNDGYPVSGERGTDKAANTIKCESGVKHVQENGVMEIGKINDGLKGEFVKVRGKITTFQEFSKGFRYEINDGTGSIILIIWENIFDKIRDKNSLKVGSAIEVCGKVAIYNDKLELIPAKAEQVIFKE